MTTSVQRETIQKSILDIVQNSMLLQGLLAHGFSKLGLIKIVAVCHPDNRASARIMEKCGMTFVGEVVHECIRHCEYMASSPLMNSSRTK